MKVQSLISNKISSFNEELRHATGSTEDFITLQILLTSANAINNNKDLDSGLYILWHTKISSVKSMKPSNKKLKITHTDLKDYAALVFDVEISDATEGYLVITDTATGKKFVSADDYESSLLNDTNFKNYFTNKPAGFTVKSVNCSTSRYPCQ